MVKMINEFSNMGIFWEMTGALGTVIAAVMAAIALVIAYETWLLEKTPVVNAVGSFIISKETEANVKRDNEKTLFTPYSW